mmetsp:Transcript_70353/g.115681  ORF Transcript_70353/g.115681 Transcript_70353/m.115681 type:complete len:727 (-) Transcript_70353:60-2240(-)
MTSLLQQLPAWIAVTVFTWVVCWVFVAPKDCQDLSVCNQQMKSYPAYVHVLSSTALVAMAGNEICGLIATYMGAKQTQALIPHLQSRCLPSFLLALMFSWLAVVEWLFARPELTLAHVHTSADGLTVSGRPVYTLRYVEWCINVPILFLLSGHCALGRPLKEISRPLMVTNVYIIFSWMATVTESGFLKWALIVLALFMYGWASMDMMNWSRDFHRLAPADLPSRSIRPWLSNGLIIHFQCFAAIYMASCLGVFNAEQEQMGYFITTFGTKIAYCATFVFVRADEYHKTLTDVLRKVSVSNVGMISILRGSFDIIVPCVLDHAGRCKLPAQMSGDMVKLEKMLGAPVAGANLKDLLTTKDQNDFAAYVRNVVRQADCPQAFSEATLTTSGIWSCGAGVTPPIAQVLHSKMQGSHAKLQASLHLSVVPRSAVSHGKERHLVAAIQFTEEEEQDDIDASCGFETFKATERQTSGQSTTISGSGSEGIVANLEDLHRLGASLGHEEEESEEGSVYWGYSRSDDTMSHLGAFVPQQSAFDARICGTWEGTTSEELGGYTQSISFDNDCLNAKITVMGQTLAAQFRMNCSVEPKQLNIQVLPKGDDPPPPAIPYIFKFDSDGSLVLCGPADQKMRRPNTFAGAGLCIMRRFEEKTEKRVENYVTQALQPLFEPDPEFSRKSTEEHGASSHANQSSDHAMHPKKNHWMQEPAVAASMALALTSTLIALKKSI